MDAGVRLATSDEARWEYVADRLTETATILERLSARLDASDKRQDAMERRQERTEERVMEHASATDSTQDQVAQATQALLLQQLRHNLSGTFTSSLATLMQNWSKVVAIASLLANFILLMRGHVAIH